MNEQDIPIDIHVNKLSDWLVSRRIVDKNWQKNNKDVRNKINEAIKDIFLFINHVINKMIYYY